MTELSKTDFRKTASQEWRYTLGTPGPREREACYELEATLGYRVRLYLKKAKKQTKTHFDSLVIQIKSGPVLFRVFAKPGPQPKEGALRSQHSSVPGKNVSFKHHIPELSYTVLLQPVTAMEVGVQGQTLLPTTVQPRQGLYQTQVREQSLCHQDSRSSPCRGF